MSLPETPGRKLRLFQQADPFKTWYSLGETRWCRRCEHLFTGHDVRLSETADEVIRFHCPTHGCEGTWADWEYPNLHL